MESIVRYLVLPILVLLSSSALLSQTVWEHPYHDGTTQVYKVYGTDWYFIHYAANKNDELMKYYSEDGWHTRILIDSLNRLRHHDILEMDSRWRVPSFTHTVLVAPPTDSVVDFEDETASLLRQFDTTVFSINVKAFDYYTSNGGYYLVAEIFGVVLQGKYTDSSITVTYKLHSFNSMSEKHNWENREFKYWPICEGYTQQYYHHYTRSGRAELRYPTYRLMAPVDLGGTPYFEAFGNFIRDTDSGIATIGDGGRPEWIMLPRNATIGTPIRIATDYPMFYAENTDCVSFVRDTATIEIDGKMRRVIKLQPIFGNAVDVGPCMEWFEFIEYIGYTLKATDYSWGTDPTFSHYRIHYSVCGETWGNLVNAEPAPPAPIELELSAHPNPVTHNETSVSYSLESPAEVEL
ncbi:MAG: hypothetical protein CL946_10130, partial [Ectothiorhodospiraceae bacterium]|nr:hypothetical protein [Ectothiorhodospiraceae bacterium]